MAVLRFVEFSKIVEDNGLPEPGYYIEHEGNINITQTLISYDPNSSSDIVETINWFSNRRFMCLDGNIISIVEIVTKSGLEIKWAKGT